MSSSRCSGEEGMSLFKSAVDGARVVPILITSFAFILRFWISIAFLAEAGGADLETVLSEWGAVGGMLIGTVFGVFVIPVLFVIFPRLAGTHFRKILR
jgi:HAE1 family hydrophobic/amphiphilic exporter-1